MSKKSLSKISTIFMFLVYIAMMFNWPNYSEKSVTSMFFLSILLAILLITLTIKIIKNKENSSFTKIGFSVILFSTVISLRFPLAILGGYWLNKP